MPRVDPVFIASGRTKDNHPCACRRWSLDTTSGWFAATAGFIWRYGLNEWERLSLKALLGTDSRLRSARLSIHQRSMDGISPTFTSTSSDCWRRRKCHWELASDQRNPVFCFSGRYRGFQPAREPNNAPRSCSPPYLSASSIGHAVVLGNSSKRFARSKLRASMLIALAPDCISRHSNPSRMIRNLNGTRARCFECFSENGA